MEIRWLGHASFLLTLEDGMKIIHDPFDPEGYGAQLTYPAITESADIVVASHDHPDHGWIEGIAGNPEAVTTEGEHEIGDVKITGIRAYHDDNRGSKRGAKKWR